MTSSCEASLTTRAGHAVDPGWWCAPPGAHRPTTDDDHSDSRRCVHHPTSPESLTRVLVPMRMRRHGPPAVNAECSRAGCSSRRHGRSPIFMTELADGLYELLVTQGLEKLLGALAARSAWREPLDPADAHEVLARHIGFLARRVLAAAAGDDRTAVAAQVDLANRMARAIVDMAPALALADDLVAEPGDLLAGLTHREVLPSPGKSPPQPYTPLSPTALLVNGRDQPRIGSEIKLELESADRVDLLCAFVK